MNFLIIFDFYVTIYCKNEFKCDSESCCNEMLENRL